MNPQLNLSAVISRTFWPEYWVEGLAVAVCVLYLWGILSSDDSANLQLRTRLMSFVGLCATGALLFLGLLSPYYGIIALLSIPAPIMFGFFIFRPTIVWNKPKLRRYLNLCVMASALVWLFQIFWQVRTWK